MKGKSDVRVALFSETFGKVVANMAESLDTYRRENAVLRELLLGLGQQPKQIHKEVKKRMKSYRIYEEATVLSHKVLQQTLDLLRANDPLATVVENLGEMRKRDAN